jgi:hypothetical protein
MQSIERVRTIAESHGLSLAEYLVLRIAAAFVMTPDQAAKFLATSLAKSGQANIAPNESCMKQGWVGLSPGGMLMLTPPGMMVTQMIATEVTTPTT